MMRLRQNVPRAVYALPKQENPYIMNYIFCSVVWNRNTNGSSGTISHIAAAKLSEKGDITDSAGFGGNGSVSDSSVIAAFAEWCGSDYMLCLWDGASAGKIKKLLSASGTDHPYIHLYHLSGLFDLSLKNCRNAAVRKKMLTALEHKPGYYGKRRSADAEVGWMCGIFGLLDFSAADKSTSFSFIEQPSNKFFVFKNGKCFHTKDCRIVKTAAVSSLRAYTYYSSVTDAGFTPCSRCKPVDCDEQTAEEMRRINSERLEKSREKYKNSGGIPVKKRRRKKMNVFRSLEHMCGMYGAAFRKSGDKVYIENGSERCYIIPESEEIRIFRQGDDGEYHPDEIVFSDPYSAAKTFIKSSVPIKK